LFETTKDDKLEKAKRESIDKISAIILLQIIDENYLNDLKDIIELDALSGHSIRFINNLKPKEYKLLPEQIEQSYIDRMIKFSREVDLGKEILILSEEIKK
jgi:hypothetical protein